MKKQYYKELPLFHIYDSNLTGSQKLLMTLLLIDDTYDIYTLSCLAKLRTEDVIFDLQKQDVHAGGSGCGCSAITLCGHLLWELSAKKLKRILFCGTGALLSPTSTQQGLPIPGVCHAVCITGGN